MLTRCRRCRPTPGPSPSGKRLACSWVCSLPLVCGFVTTLVAYEDQAELVVGDLAGVADEEVRRDQAFRPGKLAVPALDLADDAAVPQVWIRGGPKPPEPDAVKAQPVSAAELDRPEVVEGRLLAQCELAFERRFSAGDIFERAPHSVRTDRGYERCARRDEAQPQAVGTGRCRAAAELQ